MSFTKCSSSPVRLLSSLTSGGSYVVYQSSVNKTEMEQEKKKFFGAPNPAWHMSLVVITHNIKAGNLKSPCNAAF